MIDVAKLPIAQVLVRAESAQHLATIEQRFGRRLRRVREAAGDSQQRLAEACGVDRTAVFRWERGEGGPQARQLLRLLQHYREQADYLINGKPGDLPEPEPAMESALQSFLATALGKAIEAEQLTSVLSSIQFRDPPTVAQYRRIALALLGGTGDAS